MLLEYRVLKKYTEECYVYVGVYSATFYVGGEENKNMYFLIVGKRNLEIIN